MWLYFWAEEDQAARVVRDLARLAADGAEPFLKLPARDEAPLKGGQAGEPIYLGTRSGDRWAIHAEARLASSTFRGPTPAALMPIYGETGDRHWWKSLTDLRLFDSPYLVGDLGIGEIPQPRSGQAHLVRFRPPLDGPWPPHAPTNLPEAEILTVGESSEDVIVDDRGRIFRLNGEQILKPGHAPEVVLRALADLNGGKMVPLGEIRDSRK